MKQFQRSKALCIGAFFSMSAHLAMAETPVSVPTPKLFSGLATASQDRVCAEVFAGLSVAGAKGIDPKVNPERYYSSIGMAIGSGLLLKAATSLDKAQLAVAHEIAIGIASQNEESVLGVVNFCSVRINSLIADEKLTADETMKAVDLFSRLVEKDPTAN